MAGGDECDRASEMSSLGLLRHTVRIVPHDPQWTREFETIATELLGACGTAALMIEHVGSTAIPGLAAKPILDVIVGVTDLAASLDLIPALDGLGFLYRGQDDVPDRHFLRRGTGDIVTHHLSLAEPDSNYVRVTLAFRDALRADRQLAAAYEAIKHDLASRYPNDRESYINGKTAFVKGVLRSLL